MVFESGALNSDGSIQGNDNDADPAHFESHYRTLTSSDQVEIYESILGDSAGHVTTGLLSAVGYLKDKPEPPEPLPERSTPKTTEPMLGLRENTRQSESLIKIDMGKSDGLSTNL